jgi:signal transduction histidine kinase
MASVAGISLMASYMGGFSSHYFAGNLIVLFVIGIFLPWDVPAVALLCALIIATYAGIELRVEGMTRAMIGPLFYLAGAAVFTCLAVLSARRTLQRDLSLRLQLARANEELKELDAAKSRFFANVTHELRTPLTLLLGPLDSLRAEETDPARSQLLAAMNANSRRLLRQVDALLEEARLESGRLRLHPHPGHLGTLLAELATAATPHAERRGLTLRTETQTARAYAARREALIADLEMPRLSAAVLSEVQTPPGAPKVLLVEDHADLRTFVAHHLARQYQVEAVADAESGLAAARRDPPDLILADVMLPGMDGLELCRQVRADATLAGVPIVLMTAKAGADAVVEGLGVGADDYVIKPFVLRELEARIAAHLRAKEIERRLHEREGRLAAIGQMTSGLVHDLRNPLTQLKGSADLAYFLALQGGELATIIEELEVVRAGSDRLRRMIEEILDYARGGKPSLHLEKVAVRFFLDKVLDPLVSDLKERGIEAEVRIEIPDDVQATFDPDRLQRVLENLVRNAREAVQAGKRDRRIWISARLEGKALALRVADNGPGISEEVARHLFKPFATGKKQGTGLGLVTARTLVDAHGGELRVETRAPEGGAAFTVVLPLERPAHLEAQVFLSGASRE